MLPSPSRAWTLSAALAHSIRVLAWQSQPAEACGLLAGRHDPTTAAPRRDISQQRSLPNRQPGSQGFAIAPEDFARAEASLRAVGLCLLGFWHSHPGGSPVPSEADHRLAWPDALQLLFGFTAAGEPGRFALYQPQDGRLVPQPLTLLSDLAPG